MRFILSLRIIKSISHHIMPRNNCKHFPRCMRTTCSFYHLLSRFFLQHIFNWLEMKTHKLRMPEKMFTKKAYFLQLRKGTNSHIEKYSHSERTSKQNFLPFFAPYVTFFAIIQRQVEVKVFWELHKIKHKAINCFRCDWKIDLKFLLFRGAFKSNN